MAAKIRMIGPIQVIVGLTDVGAPGGGPQCTSTPRSNAVAIMYQSARFTISAGSRSPLRR